MTESMHANSGGHGEIHTYRRRCFYYSGLLAVANPAHLIVPPALTSIILIQPAPSSSSSPLAAMPAVFTTLQKPGIAFEAARNVRATSSSRVTSHLLDARERDMKGGGDGEGGGGWAWRGRRRRRRCEPERQDTQLNTCFSGFQMKSRKYPTGRL